MDRRTLLRGVGAGVAGLAGLAGCPTFDDGTGAGGETGDGSPGTPTRSAATSDARNGTDGTDGGDRKDGSATDGTTAGTVQVASVVTRLEVPWGAAWRDGDLYLTERPGRVVRVPDGRGRANLVTDGFPDLRANGEGGLLGLAFHPDEPAAFTYGTYRAGDRLENRVVRHAIDDG